jgi:hypothetical protein
MLLNEISITRLSGPSKRSEPQPKDEFDLDGTSGDEFDLGLDEPTGDEEPTDGEDEFGLDGVDGVDDGTMGTGTGQDAGGQGPGLSFSSFMGGGSPSLGSASLSTPRPGELGAEDSADDQEDPMGGEQEDPAVGQLASKATEDPNKQGLIRTVKGAHLVYKRQTEEGSYEELWQYSTKSGNFQEEMKRRKAILAGTDIPPNKTTSPDGSQSYEIWTTSNAEMMVIKGLTN